MKSDFISVTRLTLAVLSLTLFSSFAVFAQQSWRPVTQAEIDRKTPMVEPDADAEAIFWEVSLDNKRIDKLFYQHYVRVKIYTERGRERFAKIDIPFYKDKKVEEVAARVIKPDGSIVELQPSDIFEREIARAGKFSEMAKSFAVPNIAPGVIVEYQYREVFKDDTADNEFLYFQRDIPVQRLTYSVRPNERLSLSFDSVNMDPIRFIKNEEGFFVGTRENVPAYREEPQMPPESEVRQFVHLKYQTFGLFSSTFFGNSVSRGFDEATEKQKEVAQKAAELTAGAQSNEEKIQRLYDFVQKKIRNANFDRSITDEQRKDIKNKKASDTLKRGIGTSYDIDILFASLVRAAGFDANIMYSGNRALKFFNHERDQVPGNIRYSGVAIRQGNDWKPYNPGTPYMPAGMTFWNYELISTMIAGAGGYSWMKIPLADYKQNHSKRTGKFKLLDDGTLEGDVTFEYTGQSAISRRGDLYRRTPAEREDVIKKSISSRQTTFEISQLTITNFDDLSKPYSYTFHVKVPNYAQKTGKRIFLQPGFFEYGSQQVFSAETRKYAIYFQYPWSENDQVEIELPKGFDADSIDAPKLVREAGGLASDDVKIEFVKETNSIKYSREFYFGATGKVLFGPNAYKPLKFLFDAVHNADVHSISLKAKQ